MAQPVGSTFKSIATPESSQTSSSTSTTPALRPSAVRTGASSINAYVSYSNTELTPERQETSTALVHLLKVYCDTPQEKRQAAVKEAALKMFGRTKEFFFKYERLLASYFDYREVHSKDEAWELMLQEMPTGIYLPHFAELIDLLECNPKYNVFLSPEKAESKKD